MQPKQKNSNKLFPRAYFDESTTRYQRPKNNRLFIWIIFGLIVLMIGLFSFFQSDLIKEATDLSKVVR
jgi:type VI protein secretion system component VasF